MPKRIFKKCARAGLQVKPMLARRFARGGLLLYQHHMRHPVVNYKLASFDMFQTLVDVESQKYEVMKAVFGDSYTIEAANQLWEDSNQFVYKYFHRFNVDKEDFKTIVDVFTDCYSKLFPKYGIRISSRNGAMTLAKRHNDALLYPETKAVYDRIKGKYKTCLISDADVIMIKDLLM